MVWGWWHKFKDFQFNSCYCWFISENEFCAILSDFVFFASIFSWLYYVPPGSKFKVGKYRLISGIGRKVKFHFSRKCLKEEIQKGVLVTGEYIINEVPGQQVGFCSILYDSSFLIYFLFTFLILCRLTWWSQTPRGSTLSTGSPPTRESSPSPLMITMFSRFASFLESQQIWGAEGDL